MPNSDDEIVYFDGDNVIRVYDPKPSSSVLEVEWASPEGGWGNMVLGDVTGDGDLEIIAIRPDGDRGRLTIFDPVAQDSPPDQVQMFGDIPWAILYDLALPRPPRLVEVGEFDLSNDSREIIYSYTEDSEFDRFFILRSTGDGLPGRSWEEQSIFDLEGRWSAIATGNVHKDDAVDEVGLVSFERGELALYRVIPEVVQTFNNVNLEHRWRNVAIGQYIFTNNDGAEIGAVRDADLPLASTWVFRYDGVNFIDAFAERLSPSPNVVFFTNIDGNTDEELVVLRQVQQELGPRPRLILRDGNANDGLVLIEDVLDGDNEYKGADGGDVDGDGKGEIVVIRNNRIRIYTAPESAATFQMVERFTNGQTVKVGNVDGAGLSATSRVVASLSAVSDSLQPGEVGSTRVITVQDATRGVQLPFTIELEGADDWAIITQSDTTTPFGITVQLTAEGIQPGEYSGRIVVDVQRSGVENDPLVIPLALTVESVIEASPPSVDFVYYPCQPPLSPRDRDVTLSGTNGMAYSAQIEGNPDWVTVSPEAGTLPEAVTVSVDPTLRPADIVSVDLLVTVDMPDEPGVVNRVPIALACPANRIFMPTISP